MDIDQDKLMAFMNKAVGDLGAAASAALVMLGDKLGLYKALAAGGAMTPAELAKKTGTVERYVREWLNNQAAGGYVAYDPKTKKYALPPEQAFALSDENSPVFLPGGFQAMSSMIHSLPKMIENFKTGKGLDWGEQHESLFEGTERFFRANYIGNLLASWIPALDGVEAKLKAGAKVADVGCGLGASTILMAKAFPKSQFVGFDFHKPSIEKAKERAKAAGVGDRISFEIAKATDYPGKDFDFVCFFDCLHDMGDPAAVSRHVFQSLKKDGTWMIVEPFAGDAVEENLTPPGRIFYAASTCICVPASLSQNGIAIGAQAGEAKLKGLVQEGGFTRFRRATETPFNLVLEARP
ncbi:MAG TPA: methyltransferase domain-containing protein [bacterium]|nr:methyltransferase domain-containing protein [bacterium]